MCVRTCSSGEVQHGPGRRGGRRRGVQAPADALARAERAHHQRPQVRTGAAHAAPERRQQQQVRRRLAALQGLAASSRQDHSQGNICVYLGSHNKSANSTLSCLISQTNKTVQPTNQPNW